MNQEHDKDLDILLRRHAKRASLRSKIAMTVDEENGKKAFTAFEASGHLDADAMNAYTENTLPGLTRVRYAEHLINCDACRKLVTQLALAANPIEVEKKEATVVADVSKQTWREWFLSLFTIPNLKVIGPIAAVLCIAAITFVAFQRRGELPKSVASKSETEGNSAPSSNAPVYGGKVETPSGVSTASTPNPTSSLNQNTSATNGGTTTTGKEQPSKPAKTGEDDKNAKTGAPETEAGKREEPRKDAPAEKSPIVAQSTSPSPSPSGPAVSNQAQVNNANDIAVQSPITTQAKGGGPSRANRDRSAGNETSERAQQSSTDSTTAGTTAENKPKDSKTEEKQGEDKAKVARKKQANADDDELKLANKSVPTRTVGDKKFYRKGSAWVDTAYNNSSVTVIKRNSNEYNSLDAGLRSIAEQLGGEIIVVWNGRAYKIR